MVEPEIEKLMARGLALGASEIRAVFTDKIHFEKTLTPLGFKVEFDPGGTMLPSWYGMVLLD